MKILVTGGAGFIGSAVVRHLVQDVQASVVTLDKLTYAGRRESLADIMESPRHAFERADICDAAAVARIFNRHAPDAVMHLAAESHVDRSIDGPADFVQTNLVGTYTLLEAARAYHDGLPPARRGGFRVLHVSTDEVYGDLGADGGAADETAPYRPNSPYAATKAGADHLARAWHRTYGLPVVISNCCNNYGPYQFPEKLIPTMILAALAGRPLPVYGDGQHERDWLHVADHAEALHLILTQGQPGEVYNVGGGMVLRNLELVRAICACLDMVMAGSPHCPHDKLIAFVEDRPGHDVRYAVDSGKLAAQLGWRARRNFKDGLRDTVQWYIDRRDWWEPIRREVYGGERQGVVP